MRIINSFFYSFGQGIKNIFRNKLFSLATLATIGSCVFLFGLFYSVVLNFQYIVREAQQSVAVTVFFEEGIADGRIAEIGEDIKKRGEVSRVEFVSAEEAWETFRAENLGEYADSFGDDNPLEGDDNYEIYLNDVSMQDELVSYLEAQQGVRQVRKSAIVANMLSSVNSLVGYVAMGIIGILFLVSIFLISNTVAAGIAVRREEIGIMKLIGATDFVVRAPFVFEGIFLGFLGAAVPLVVVYFIYSRITAYVIEHFSLLNSLLKFLPVNEIFYTLLPVALIMGVGIGFLGSFMSVHRYLKV
ncbi:MAG: permease-like cell division protein FtsX [Lachnospiraceae bacterium]|nr:permease-like cell division protein FtsX [Lachnospiraceae bacterium]